ncbi:MAG: SDR family NAD(P)-dependent oxidoreductase [Candidatus Micrarchaeota archaeon]
MNKRILVTGGAGFVGSHICEQLVSKEYKVVILDDFSTGTMDNIRHIKNKIEIIEGGITFIEDVEKALSGVDYVIHEAAIVSVADSIKDPEKCYEINVEGTKNVLNLCAEKKIKKVVLASSAAVYGDSTPPIKETEQTKPISPYGISKLMNEQTASWFSTKYNLPTICLRYFNIYGPRQDPGSSYAGVISKFIDCVKNDKNPIIFGDGSQTRDFIYVKDVARATILAMESNLSNVNLNIATGKQTSINTLFSTIKKILHSDINPKNENERIGDIKYSYADVNMAKELLKFKAEYNLEQGLKEMLEPQ